MSLVRTPYYVASLIAQWVYIDSGVTLDRLELEKKLKADCRAADPDAEQAQLLTDDECERFVCGAEGGEIPVDLICRFPRTHSYLNGELT